MTMINDDTLHDRSRWLTLGGLLLVAALAFAFGWPSRHGEFLYGDDRYFVVEHVFINHPSWRNAWNLVTMVHSDLYQPIPMLSLMLDYALAGPDVAGRFPVSTWTFHVTNIALHTLNAAMAFLIVLRLARCRRVALVAGLLFACHPFAMEPVAWITGRMVLLTATFSLALILVCLSRRPGHEGRWAILAIAAWLGSVLSKMLPSVPLAAAWCDVQFRGRLTRRAWLVYAILLVIGAAGTTLAVRATHEMGFFEDTQAEATTSIPVRILIASRYYFENYLWPARLSAWAPPPHRVPFLSLPVAIALAEWAALFALLLWSRRRCRLAYVGLVLFLLLIAPFLAAVAARTFLTADRYMYLPMLGLHLALAAAVVQVFDALHRKWSLLPATALFGTAILALVAVYLQIGWRQAGYWKNMVAQAHRTLEVFPDSVDAYYEVARSYTHAGDLDGALRIVQEGRRRWPDDPGLALRAGEVYRHRKDWPRAEKELSYAAARLGGSDVFVRHALARVLDEVGRHDEARDYYRRILDDQPGNLPTVVALAKSFEKTAEWDAALAAYRRAVGINPFHRDSLLSLAVLLMKREEWTEAKPHLLAILELNPNDQAALLNLGVVEARSGNAVEAEALYNRLIEMDANNTSARLNRAALWMTTGRNTEAQTEFRAILTKDPDNRDAMIGLHEALQRAGQFRELVALWRAYKGDSIPEPERWSWLVWSLALTHDGDHAVRYAAPLPEKCAPRSFANWAIAYLAFVENEINAPPEILGPPSSPTVPTTNRLEWLRMVQLALEVLPSDQRNSPAGLYLLARLALENNNTALAAQAARQCAASATDAQLKNAANAVLEVIAKSQEKSSTTTQKSQPPDGLAG
ncbi:MAG TPA: tetratricopeptide repeat protein [Phycisphaerae bacterium]|nr:tetratricopeptide repeat protein [Phycisphaerae bacterium]